jgi:predicted metal-dependent peptidase
VFEDVSDIERFVEETDSWTLKGYGGTSFCPVFEKVNALKEEGEDIECLIYLSDGYGDFPKEVPGYPVFMAFPKEDWEFRKKKGDFDNNIIPDWIRDVKLD